MKTRNPLLTMVLASTMLVLLPACATASASELAGTTWVLNVDNEPAESAALINTGTATITFGPGVGEVTGKYGINKYAGGYEIDGDDISFSDLRWTTMACMAAGGTMNLEQAYMFALEKSQTYSVDGDTLTINCGDTILEFTRQ